MITYLWCPATSDCSGDCSSGQYDAYDLFHCCANEIFVGPPFVDIGVTMGPSTLCITLIALLVITCCCGIPLGICWWRRRALAQRNKAAFIRDAQALSQRREVVVAEREALLAAAGFSNFIGYGDPCTIDNANTHPGCNQLDHEGRHTPLHSTPVVGDPG